MRATVCFALLFGLLACGGCGKKGKSTPELLADLKSPVKRDRLIAVRLLPQRQDEAAAIVPALIEALNSDEEIRADAAWGLGCFGERAREAVPALVAARSDRDARVRRAAGLALSRIDSNLAPKTTGKSPRGP